MRVFNVGKALNEKYSPFLAAENPEDVLYATSTASPRAIVSMQLLLSGLFPPSYSQLWNRDLIWQPLPFKITPRSHDKVTPIFIICTVFDSFGRRLSFITIDTLSN